MIWLGVAAVLFVCFWPISNNTAQGLATVVKWVMSAAGLLLYLLVLIQVAPNL